jgi:hypothetical protein
VSGKWLNSRTYGIMTLLFSIPGILSIAVSKVYLPDGSLYALPLLVLGLLLVVVSVVFLFFFLYNAMALDTWSTTATPNGLKAKLLQTMLVFLFVTREDQNLNERWLSWF